jgi:hypothetical protein
MTLQELLDELRVNVLHDDAGLASGPDDRLWSDDTLVRYLNDAERRFARQTLCLRDASTPEVVEVTLTSGVADYSLHKSVRAVVSARYEDDSADLGRVGHVTMQEIVPPETIVFDVNQVSALTPGKPLAISTDEALDLSENAAVVLTVWPTPSDAEEGKRVLLRVARTPLVLLDLERADKQCPEIPEEYHLDLCEWAAYRCFRTSDLDGASDKATQHEQRFAAAISEVMRDVRKKMHAPARFAFGAFAWS